MDEMTSQNLDKRLAVLEAKVDRIHDDFTEWRKSFASTNMTRSEIDLRLEMSNARLKKIEDDYTWVWRGIAASIGSVLVLLITRLLPALGT